MENGFEIIEGNAYLEVLKLNKISFENLQANYEKQKEAYIQALRFIEVQGLEDEFHNYVTNEEFKESEKENHQIGV